MPPKQLELFSVITDVYASSPDEPILNKELYKKLVDKRCFSKEEMESKEPVGQSNSNHNLSKRKVRWYQQTLKKMGIIERVNGSKGLWQLTEKQGKELHKAASGVKMLAFSTDLGVAIWGENKSVFASLDEPIALCITSPPYPLKVSRQYGNPNIQEYIYFILSSLEPIVRSLIKGGSIVINFANDIFESGMPSRSLYLEQVVLAICEELGLHLMDRIPWVNKSKPPGPTYWTCVNRYQLSAAYEPIYWFTNDPLSIRADNRRVLEPHSDSHIKLMRQGGERRNIKYGDGAYHLREKSFSQNTPGKIPRNVLERGHSCSDSRAFRHAAKELHLPTHGAMFPSSIPEFFIKYLTEPGDLVVDLFSGSGKTGLKAEELGRRWIISEWILEYIRVSAELFKQKQGFVMNPILLDVA